MCVMVSDALIKHQTDPDSTHMLPEKESQDGSCQLSQEDEEDEHKKLGQD